MTPDGDLRCWGSLDWPIAVPPPLTGVVEVVSGRVHHCAAGRDSDLNCWGDSGPSSAGHTLPDGWDAVATGGMHTCGLRDGAALCWGEAVGGILHAPEETFVALTAGAMHTCGVLEDGRVLCWGGNGVGQSSPP